jgi:ribosome recycling factor
VRNIRRDARKHLETAEKAGDISHDELDRAAKALDKRAHEHGEEIGKARRHTEHELIEV